MPFCIVFYSNDAIVNGDGYAEYGVTRADNDEGSYWAGSGQNIEYYSDKSVYDIANWLESNKNGVEYSVSAIRINDTVFIKMNAGDMLIGYTAVSVANEKAYLSISAEKCKLSNIKIADKYESFEIPESIKDVAPPNPFVPDESEGVIDNGDGFLIRQSAGYEITSAGVAVEFNSKTYEKKPDGNATEWYNAPVLHVYANTENSLSGIQELAIMRGDDFGWIDSIVDNPLNSAAWDAAGYKWVSRGVPDWTAFRNANVAGVKASVSAVRENNSIIIKFSINGFTKYLTIPDTISDKNVYFSLSGDVCKLTDITPVAYKKINIPGAVASYPVDTPTATPAPTLPPVSDDEEQQGLELDCPGWWSGHTAGLEVTEDGVALSFKNKTYSTASDNWDTPIVVAFSSEDGNVKTAGTAGYTEYVVIRSDNYAWKDSANTGDGIAAWNALGYTTASDFTGFTSWESWLADNKAGVDCKVQAIKKDGKVIIEFTNNNVTSWTTFPVADGTKVLISLTGQDCKLTDIKPVKYTGINLPDAAPTTEPTPEPTTEPSDEPTTAPSNTPDDSNNPSNDNNNPGGDTQTPGNDNNNNNNDNVNNDNNNNNNDNQNDDKETKKTMKVSSVTAKAGTKKVTGKVSVKGATVKVKVGSGKYKKATVSGKKFTFKNSKKIKKGTKITVKVTKSGYKTVTKTVKAK